MRFLFVNPYVYDFACYDYWLKPLGLLYLSSLLKEKGHSVEMIDFMDRHHRLAPYSEDSIDGRGHFSSIEAAKPEALINIPRKYKQYGVNREKADNLLEEINRPDIVFLGSGMTYWYMSAAELSGKVRKKFPNAEIVAGGTYVSLCTEHAKTTINADRFVTASDLPHYMNSLDIELKDFSSWPEPDYSFYGKNPYIAYRTSEGCMRSCPYCGINKLSRGFSAKSSDVIRREISRMSEVYDCKNFALYDDALLSNEGFLEYMGSPLKDIYFYNPNGLDINKINRKVSGLLFKGAMKNPCISVDIMGSPGDYALFAKTEKRNIKNAAECLFSAGYRTGQVSVYLLLAHPGQDLDILLKDIDYLHSISLLINLSEYAIVPGSKDSMSFPEEILNEPLYHNNSIYPAVAKEKAEKISRIKNYVNQLNRELKL